MARGRFMRIVDAANAALSTILRKIEEGSLVQRAVPRCEPLEERTLFDMSWQEWWDAGGYNCYPTYPIEPYICDCNDPEVTGHDGNAGPGGNSPGSGPGVGPVGGTGDTNGVTGSQTGGHSTGPVATPPSGAHGSTAAPSSGLPSPGDLGESPDGVMYLNGMPQLTTTDLSSDGFGKEWGVTRSFQNTLVNGPQGGHWDNAQMPHLDLNPTGIPSDSTITEIGIGYHIRVFKSFDHGATYTEASGGQDKFYHDTTNHLIDISDTAGGVAVFDDYTTGANGTKAGSFVRYDDLYGNHITASAYDTQGTYNNISETKRVNGQVIEDWQYNYGSFVFNSQPVRMITNITLRRSTNGGTTWNNVREVDYSYFDGSFAGNMIGGNVDDLRSVAIADPNKAISVTFSAYTYNSGNNTTTITVSAANSGYSSGDTIVISGASQAGANGTWVISNANGTGFQYTVNGNVAASGSATANKPWDVSYNRYYTPNDDGGITVIDGMPKYVLDAQDYARARAAGIDPSTAPDSVISTYANDYFEYDSQQRVTKHAMLGGTSTYLYSYFAFAGTGGTDEFNDWVTATRETLPDQSTDTIYFNADGQAVMTVHGDSTGNQWANYYRYGQAATNLAGLLTEWAMPSGVTVPSNFVNGDDQNHQDLSYYLNANTGLIKTIDYWGPSDPAPGYFKDVKVQQGANGGGSAITLEQRAYTSHTSGSSTIHPVSGDTLYGTAGGDPRGTSYAYTWQGTTNEPATTTVTYPTISGGTGGQNGPGTADTETYTYDPYGRVTQVTDGDGYVRTTAYDPNGTGAVTQTVVDPGASPHLNLTTSYVVDGLGRVTQETEPDGEITYTVYNDANHELRVYHGWQKYTGSATSNGTTTTLTDTGLTGAAGAYVGQTILVTGGTDNGQNAIVTQYNPAAHTLTFYPPFTVATSATAVSGYVLAGPTGPIQITREYRPAANSPLGQQTVYDETLTVSTAPTINSIGQPTGQEAINASNIQSLSRDLTNNAGQTSETDNYFSLSGIAYSAANAYLGGPFRADGTTLSSWSGTYGANGYDIADSPNDTSWPSYLPSGPTITSASTGTWTTTAGSPLLLKPNSSAYSNTYWYSTTSFTVGMNFTDANYHQVALYLVDFDKLGCAQRIDLVNAANGTLLDSRVVSNFSQGEYLVYDHLSGHVTFTITNLSGSPKAVLSGLFFDNPGTLNYAPTVYGYDVDGRQNRVVDPNDTITDTTFDSLSRVTAVSVGTNDKTSNNMTLVSDYAYDTQNAAQAPSLTTTGGGSQPGTYYVKISYVIGSGQSPASIGASLTVAANQLLVVNSPTNVPQGVTQYDVYVGTVGGLETFQMTVNVGTNWTEPTGGISTTGAAPQLSGMGDGNLMQVAQHVGGGQPDRFTETLYDFRDRAVVEKDGAQASEDTNTHRPIFYYTLDNLGEVTQTDRYDGDTVTLSSLGSTNGIPNPPSSTLLRARTTQAYDDQGRVYVQTLVSVDASGHVGSSLATNFFYDHRGNLIEESDPGGLAYKHFYDAADRDKRDSTTDGSALNNPSQAGTWNAAASELYDVTLEQTLNYYDANSNLIETIQRQRFDNDPSSATGDLNGPGGANLASRDYYTGMYYDAGDRLTDSANVGTNDGSAWTMPAAVPARSDTALVTSTGYKADEILTISAGGSFTLTFEGQMTSGLASSSTAAQVQTALQGLSTIGSGNVLVTGPTGGPWTVRFTGALAEENLSPITASGATVVITNVGGDGGRQQKTTDPRGIVNKNDVDLLGRTSQTIVAFDGLAGTASTDQTTIYTYDGNNDVLTMTAVQPTTTPNQTTAYVYGVGSTGNLFSNDLIATVEYPDKTTGLASTAAANDQSFGYDFLGEKTSFTDQNGTTHSYNYDVLGRLTADIVTTLGSGVDPLVRRLGYSFDSAGRPYQQTSYSNVTGATVLNQVQDAYNGFGQLTTEYQEHVGAVNTNTSKKVQYGYTSGANYSRLTSITDPNLTRVITYNYNGANGLDGVISRVSSMSDGSTTLESYTYLGLGTIVQKYRQQPNITLSYIQQSGDQNPPPSTAPGGDRYTGLDAFGRVIDQPWIGAAGINSPTDRFQYAYDRDSNALYRNNIVNTAFGELYHSNGAAENSSYDNLNRLTNFSRGVLSASGNNGTMLDQISSPSTSNNWNLDALGNHVSTATQSNNTFNAQNQITGMAGFTTPTYDNNGNMKKDEAGNTYSYDAWNRLVYSTVGSTTEYNSYDADNRRPGLSICSGAITNSYYSTSWQDVEDDVYNPCGGTTTVSTYVWGLSYIDDMVARDQSVNGGAATRIYAQQDANHDVTALVNTSGTVLERFVYDPYGTATVLNASWNNASDAYSWVYRFQGGRYDPISGKINFRNRDLDTVTGTWMEQDPAGYASSANLYQVEEAAPTAAVDPFGLQANRRKPVGAELDNIKTAICLLKHDAKYKQFGMLVEKMLANGNILMTDLGFSTGSGTFGQTRVWTNGGAIEIDPFFAALANCKNRGGIAHLAETMVHEWSHLTTFDGNPTGLNWIGKILGGAVFQVIPWWEDDDGNFRSLGEYFNTNLGIDVRNDLLADLKKGSPCCCECGCQGKKSPGAKCACNGSH